MIGFRQLTTRQTFSQPGCPPRRRRAGRHVIALDQRDTQLASLPDAPCDICHATGIPTGAIGHPRHRQTGGAMAIIDPATGVPFETACALDLEEIAASLEARAGFRICRLLPPCHAPVTHGLAAAIIPDSRPHSSRPPGRRPRRKAKAVAGRPA
jgi:hypothetical protein